MKLGVILDGTEVRAIRIDRYEHFSYENGTPCIHVQSSGSMTDLLIRLSTQMTGPWYVLYVLLVSRRDRQVGRYQGIEICSHLDLAIFLTKYRDYFDGDGRHHIWVGSTTGSDLLVYDHHDKIFAYGAPDKYSSALHGYALEPIQVGGAHAHYYNPEFDCDEDAIFNEWAWRHCPLQESDDPGRA